MIINVQKTTSAKRDVNISLLEKCYWIFHFSIPTAPAFFYLFTFKSFFPSNGASFFTFLPFYLFTFKNPFYL